MIAEGIAEFNRGEYWEAHERWEQVWRKTENPAERAQIQGAIQAAGVFVLLSKGRANAAARLARRALLHLERGEGASSRIEIEGVQALLERIARGPSRVDDHLAEARLLRARLVESVSA